MCDRQHLFLDGGIGGQDQIVLIHTHAVVALTLQDSYHPEGKLVEADHLTHRAAAIREEVIHHRLTEYADFSGSLHILLTKHLAILDLIATDLQIVRADAIDRSRCIVGSIDGLSTAVHGRGGGRYIAGLVHDVLIVLQLQGLHGGGILTLAAHHVRSGLDHDHVRAHLTDLRLNALLRTLTNRQHGDHGGHTNDDTQHGEETAQFVVSQCSDRYL